MKRKAISTSSAGKGVNSPIEERDHGEKKVSVSMVLTKDGSITIGENADAKGKPTLLKAVEIPESWKKHRPREIKLSPSNEDWACIEAAMTDIPEKKRKQLINEATQIYNGKSKLSEEEQKKVLEQIGRYLIQATEGNGTTLKWGTQKSGHLQISTRAGDQLSYVTPEHVTTLKQYSGWGDEKRREPFQEIIANRHSCVLGEWGFPLCDNYAPASCEYFMNLAKDDFRLNNVNSGYINVAKGLHYIEDLGCPFHTSSITGQVFHSSYESWVSSHWSELESALQVENYYLVRDPLEDSKYLARYSHQKLQAICDIMGKQGWADSHDDQKALIKHTKEMLKETEKMTLGILAYSTTFHSPETVGPKSVPISGNSTAYAHIDNIACSEKMFVCLKATLTCVGDLEIWLGYTTDPSSPYTEMKMWDHQGGNTDCLDLTGILEGFQDIHHWRLRIDSSAGEKEGYLEEFRIHIG
jgi:hypothetical protein